MEGKTRFRHPAGLDAFAASYPVDLSAARGERRCHRQSRARVSAGAAAGDDDPHADQQPRPEAGLDGGTSPEASQRVTAPSGVAKREAETPLALPPTPAMETLPTGAGGNAKGVSASDRKSTRLNSS